MTPEHVTTLGLNAIKITLMVSAPLLLTALVIGLIISIFQAATQINEATLSFIPKLIAVFAVLVLAGPWMMEQLLEYIIELFSSIPRLIG